MKKWLDGQSDKGRQGGADTIEINTEKVKSKKALLVNNKFPKQKKRWSVRKKAIVFSCIGVVMALVIAASAWALTIMSDPLAQFNPGDTQPTPTTEQTETVTNGPTGEVTPTPTPDPEQVLLSQADLAILQDKFINILLIGVDHADERDTWNGKQAFHADVMIVLCINKETGKVSMISLPRDTYAKIPGVDGIYKLNASLDCGGGWPTGDGDTGGFDKACEAAEWMLGGIPVDYYFAVDMGAVKGLVDQIGGVDYDMDIKFYIQDRYYEKGQQHMDGQAVLDYLRVRKKNTSTVQGIIEGDTGDGARVIRQKDMLIAIFEKIKANGMLVGIPDLITTFDGNLYYNMTFGQISGLVYYALTSVDTDDIEMYSMNGSSASIFNWNFIITNQTNRVNIIKKIYGLDVPKNTSYSLEGAQLLWGQMQAPQFAKVAEPILNQVKGILDVDALKPVGLAPPLTASSTPSSTPASTPDESAGSTEGSTPTEEPTSPPIPTPVGSYRQYGDAEWAFYNQMMSEYEAVLNYDSYDSGSDLIALVNQFKSDVITLCGMFNITPPSTSAWSVNYEKNSNEVYVDFR